MKKVYKYIYIYKVYTYKMHIQCVYTFPRPPSYAMRGGAGCVAFPRFSLSACFSVSPSVGMVDFCASYVCSQAVLATSYLCFSRYFLIYFKMCYILFLLLSFLLFVFWGLYLYLKTCYMYMYC